MRLLYVHKHNAQDPTDLALRKWFLRELPGSSEFTFAPEERSRNSSPGDPPLRRFLEAVEAHGSTHVFSWVLYPNPAEVRWLRNRGVVLAGATSGAADLSHGFIPDQGEYLDYLRQHNFFFTPHAQHVPLLREAGVNACELPFCFDEDVYRPLAGRSVLAGVAPFRGTYIGNFGPPEIAQGRYRADVLREIARAFRLLLVCDSRYREYDLGGGVIRLPTVTRPGLLNLVLNSSSFTVGTDGFPEVDVYLRGKSVNIRIPYDPVRDYFVMRPRTFWAMASGTPFVVEDYPEMRRFFSAGEEILLWKKPSEAVEQLREFARDPSQLRALGARGAEKVRRLHSARVRVRQVLRMLEGAPAPDFAVGGAPA